ncbi:MAG: hypothetical protein QOC65_98 [Sphingomonadales bacterium]|nr:hypothetical protein [Sphingomonadales bacterium]
MADAQQQLDGFLAKFSPEVEALAHALLTRLRRRLPGATMMVYDNYNALAIGFGPSDKVSRAVVSLAVYPRWVNLFFLHAVGLRDPEGLLKGEGSKVRHIRLTSPEAMDEPAVAALIAQAAARADPPFDPDAPGRLLIKSVQAKQRPRRPPVSP